MGRRLALFNVALIILLQLATAIGIIPAMAADSPPSGNLTTGIELPNYKVPGLGSSLVQLVKGLENGQAIAVAEQLNIDFKDSKARVIVEALPGKATEAAALARALGANVETTYEDLIQVTVPVTALTVLASSNIVSLVRQPYTSVPEAVSQGVSLINASAWQAAGYTGAGTKVGILDVGFSGYTSLLGTDLPSTVTTWWAPSIGGPGTDNHGTACAEVIYDVAPGAQFYLANCGTDVEYANAVTWLISQGVNVISHSLSSYYGQGNGTGFMCTQVNNARTAGVTWAQAAGNHAQEHWKGTFNDLNADKLHEFQSPNDNLNRFSATAGQSVYAALRWNDTWGASGNDYDLFLCYFNGASWQVVASSTALQTGTQNPYESISYTVPTTGTYAVAINKYSAIGNASMDLMAYVGALQYPVVTGSVIIPGDSPDAVTVGAVLYSSPVTIETYSGQGPTTDGRVKPDLVGPDGIANSTISPFYGTSASTPHIAGAAALVKQRFPTYTPAQIQSYLESNAVDLGSAGKDNIFGSGRLNLPAIPITIPPTITNSSGATDITSTTATLNGNLISDGGAATTVHIYWGDNDGGTGAWDHDVNLGVRSAGAFSIAITSLTTGTTYYYRCSATNSAGTAWAANSSSFTTNYYPAGTNPIFVAVGDFDKDGDPDIAVANRGSNNVSILLGNGIDAFAGAVNCASGSGPYSIATGDFNKDGTPDLAVANFGSDNVSILIGIGNGAFGTAVNYLAGTHPSSVATGDFNGDGTPDLSVTNFGSDNVSILIGIGNGTFGTKVDYPVGTDPISIAVGDFNMDGKTDLATVNYGGNNVSILLGNGDSTFHAEVAYTAGVNPISIVTGDFNRDGKPDLAVANDTTMGSISMLLGDGLGGFAMAVDYPVGSNPYSVAAGDFNGDGKTDLAVANYTGNKASILIGTGDGTFNPAVNFTVGNGPASIAVGDFNRDGTDDLAVANFNSNNITILLTSPPPAGVLFKAAVNNTVGTNPQYVAVEDFNLDGKPDLAVANSWSSNVSILIGAADGTFISAVNYEVGAWPLSVAVSDFNLDGKSDLAVANHDGNHVSILLGNGDGTFATELNYTAGPDARSIAVGDFNRDGKTDLAVANGNSSNVSILLGTGSGTFNTAVNYAVGNQPYTVAAGDFNRDGKLDLATANYSDDNVSILIGIGNGTFNAAVNYAVGNHPYTVSAGDFNRDGKPDLAVANLDDDNVSVLIGVGNGTFNIAVNYAAGTTPRSVVMGDFNRDGKPDLATANYGSNNVSILLGDGNGIFGAAVNYTAGTNPVFVAVGDLNRDGVVDLATANYGSNNVSILLQAGNGIYGYVGIGTENPQRPLHLFGNACLFERNSDSAGFIIKRTATNRWVFGVDELPQSQFVIKTYPEGQPATVRMSISTGGAVNIPGALSKGSGTFRIDHPLDPANKYLSHSFVESPDMLNVYNGNAVLDGEGKAVIQLPAYFETLNRDFSYQLECVGSYAPLYIAREIKDNRFILAGGRPGMKVSWQVVGIRQDPYASAHPVIVEQEKPAR